MTLATFLKLAAIAYPGILCAGAAMPKAVDLRAHLQRVPEFIQRLFWVYYAFIGFIVASFGLLTWRYADAMASGEPMARSFAILMTLFWSLRLAVAGFVFDLRPYLTTPWRKTGYFALNVTFTYLVVIYAWTALV